MAGHEYMDPRFSRRVRRQREPGAQAPLSLAAREVLALQRTAGNGAVARLLAPPSPTLARAITVGGQRYTHGSRRVVDLYQSTVLPALESQGYKTFGVKARLVDYIRNTDADYGTDTQFLEAFVPWLGQQTRKVRGDKTTPVLKKFSVMGMSRPAWPEALKQLKGVQAGDNVRHVVRNATLKRALDVAWNLAPEQDRKGAFAQLATALALQVGPQETAGDIATNIYKKLYLHPDNLFAGDGPVNQVIGFASDPVRAVGEELLAQEGEVDVAEVYKSVMLAIYKVGNSEKIKVDDGYRQEILHDINAIVQDAIGALRQGESMMVPAEAAGDLVVDIGLGFGFDLIDGRVASDLDGIAARQARLLWAERALNAYISSGGQGNLTLAFQVFLGLANPPSG